MRDPEGEPHPRAFPKFLAHKATRQKIKLLFEVANCGSNLLHSNSECRSIVISTKEDSEVQQMCSLNWDDARARRGKASDSLDLL